MNLNITFAHGVQAGMPHTVPAGRVVTATMPTGVVLRAGPSLDALSIVSSPHTVPSGGGVIRIDCDAYEGAPKTATLEISQ